jgi:hypothetical protein
MADEVRHVSKDQLGKEMVTEKRELRKAEKEKRKASLAPPPPPPVKVGDVLNPLIGSSGLKRAMTVALSLQVGGDERATAVLVRASGILHKANWKPDAETDPLTQHEWSGRLYAHFVTGPAGKAYAEKYPEKMAKVQAFAAALATLMKEAIAKHKAEREEAARQEAAAKKTKEEKKPEPAKDEKKNKPEKIEKIEKK